MTRLLCCAGAKTGVFRIPQSVTAINAVAFNGCVELTEVIIPENVPQIYSQTFENCVNLRIVHIPQSIQSIFGYAFDGCYSLEYIYYQGNWEQWNAMTVDESGNDAFYGAQVSYLGYSMNHDISWVLTEGGELTVSGGALLNPVPWDVDLYRDLVQHVVLMEGITVIGNKVFEGYSNITSLTLPESLTTIGDSAFAACSGLTEITIPAGVTVIGYDAFNSCSALTDIHVDPDNTTYSDISGVLFDAGKHELIKYPANHPGNSYTIPDGVTDITAGWHWYLEDFKMGDYGGASAFIDCARLTSIIIPSGVTKIGDAVFGGCENLTDIWIPITVTEIGGYAFADCPSLENIHYAGTLEQWKAVNVNKNGNDQLDSAVIYYGD